jgi:GLPGLI family protein
MKRFLLFYLLLIISNNIYAQSEIGPNVFATKRDIITVDSGNLRVSYALNAVDINDIKTYDDIQRLEVGSTLSKYYSYFVFRNDSLVKDWKKKNPNAQYSPNKLGEFGKKGFVWSLVIWSDYFKYFSKNNLTEYALLPVRPLYQSTEGIPIQDWELHDDTLTVCGYLCQKATCRFRGNDFMAWFAPELPVSNGPWKFGGLPGLILKVYDHDKYYDFECIKIENHSKKFPIVMYNEKYYQKIERVKLRQLEKDVHADFHKMAGWTKMDGTPLPFEPNPYHPLEFE